MSISLSEEWRPVLLGCLLCLAGSVIFFILPPYLAMISTRLNLDSAQMGTLVALESLGIGLTSLLGPFWISRVNQRWCALAGSLICVVGNLVMGLINDFDLMLWIRFVVGLVGEGTILTVGTGILAGVHNVDRGFAILITITVAFGSFVVGTAAFFESYFPGLGPIVPLIVLSLATLFTVIWLPLTNAASTRATHSTARREVGDWRAIVALLAQAIWFSSPGAFWTFAEQVATNKGIAGETAELALSIGELAGLIGSIAAAWLGERWGRLWPIIGSTVGMVAAAVAYQFSGDPAALAVFLTIFYGFWNYGTVYQMSLVAELDRTGRAAVVMPAAQTFGLSAGPFFAGRMIMAHGDSAVTTLTLMFACVGLLLYLICYVGIGRTHLKAHGT